MSATGTESTGAPPGATRQEPTDEELDQYIRTRLALIGIDLGVLPEDDSSASADQVRILRSIRGLLRGTVPALSNYELDPQRFPPSMLPAHLPAVTLRGAGAEGPMVEVAPWSEEP